MVYVQYAKRRYSSAIAEIERLKQSEFPYAHIREALFQLEKVFHDQLAQLNKLTPKSTPMIAKNACSQSLTYLFNYTPFLGFILRATNVRNAFELYAACHAAREAAARAGHEVVAFFGVGIFALCLSADHGLAEMRPDRSSGVRVGESSSRSAGRSRTRAQCLEPARFGDEV